MAMLPDVKAGTAGDWDDDNDDDEAYVDGPTRRRSNRMKRRKHGDGKPLRVKAMDSSPAPAVTLQPLIDVLALKYAPVESEDVDFDAIFGLELMQYAKLRDEVGMLHERDGVGRPYSLLSPAEEVDLIWKLEARDHEEMTVAEAIVLRKLKLQRHMRMHGLPRPHLRPKSPISLTALPSTPKAIDPNPEVLHALYNMKTTPYERSFLSRLNGFGVHTSPTVAIDWEARSPWMDLMEDIRAHYVLKFPDREVPQESVAPITYLTLRAEHLPQVHDLLHRSFWTGIDVGDSLQHKPEQTTIVAMYKRLVVGCALLGSPVETYITYLAVRAGWENAQIATSMLYYLIERNPNKDVTLHVSANNPAMLLYNRFGFKAEEFIVGFYEDYLDPQSRASKNAFRLRLRR